MIPTVCTPISNEITSLNVERHDLQQQLQSASTSEKPQLAAEIKQLNTQIEPPWVRWRRWLLSL
jgi:hypothetical protein